MFSMFSCGSVPDPLSSSSNPSAWTTFWKPGCVVMARFSSATERVPELSVSIRSNVARMFSSSCRVRQARRLSRVRV